MRLSIQYFLFLLPLLFLSGAASAIDSGKIQWRYGEGICVGTWKYDQFQKCAVAGNPVATYKTCRHSSHGVERYKESRTAACGVNAYNSRTDASVCGTSSECTRTERACTMRNPTEDRSCIRWEERCFATKQVPNRCSNPAFGVSSYKSCRHKNHGPELYNNKASSSCGVASYQSAYSENCSLKENIVSKPSIKLATHDVQGYVKNSNGSLVAGTIKAQASEYSGMGSACTTCDDLPISTPAERQKKFLCLEQAIINAEDEAPNFGLSVLRETVSAGKELLKITEREDDTSNPSLTEDQRQFLQDLTILHPTVRYDNPLLFQTNFKVLINFQPRGEEFSIESAVSDTGRRYRRGTPLSMGWRLVENGSGLDVRDRAFGVDAPVSDAEKPFLSGISFADSEGTAAAQWEIKLNPGTYKVIVGIGEVEESEGTVNVVNVEGNPAVSFTPSFFQKTVEAEVTVNLEDDFLTIDGSGSTNGKISWISIESI
ncbi:MAG: hypothetical protein HRU19_12145 [Pseudobacteriovorax sp.]|nr:hypothetical protein [Pseudobacteriovorax sp.]